MVVRKELVPQWLEVTVV